MRFILFTDDLVGLNLRLLGAHIFEWRTKDEMAAARVRGTSAPGAGNDVLPEWLVTEGTAISKQEQQRETRLYEELRRRKAKEKKKGDGKGKGKDD